MAQVAKRATLRQSDLPRDPSPPAGSGDDDQTLDVSAALIDKKASSSESSSSDSSESSDVASIALEESFGKKTDYQVKAFGLIQEILDSGDDLLYHHLKFGTIHLKKRNAEAALCCGRVLHTGFGRLREVPSFDWPMCSTCFSKYVPREVR